MNAPTEYNPGITLKLNAISNRSIEEDQLFELFHKAWGQAKLSKNYTKDIWLELHNKLNDVLDRK